MSATNLTGPVWDRARAHGRTYITPEDIRDAQTHVVDDKDGAADYERDIWKNVLEAVESGAAEDISACAFVALNPEGP